MNGTIFVTGGAGFIGSNFVVHTLTETDLSVVNLDALTYAANPMNLQTVARSPRYTFVQGSIGDRDLVARLLDSHAPVAVVNFAAESHVDRSILAPEAFVDTNVTGTFRLLDEVRQWWSSRCPPAIRASFRFLHVSTDEVYGSLSPHDEAFSESSPYAPNSPYAASKAAADHFVRSFHRTYGVPAITTNCSNNFGPLQHPEKLIPLMILHGVRGKPLPVYGDGLNVRDWLYVADHCRALLRVLADGRLGETYNIGGGAERANVDVVHDICDLLDTMRPRADGRSHRAQIEFVPDRPGHDRRYAVNTARMRDELGWEPRESFASALDKTVRWYLENDAWIEQATRAGYDDWVRANYGLRGRTP